MKDAAEKTVRITTLEMKSPPNSYPQLQMKSKLAIMQAPDIPLSFYRYLYGEVGKSHYWFLRSHMSDRQLGENIHGKNIHINVLYCDGAPAGFAELDDGGNSSTVELLYFGLCPQFVGRGLGNWYLGQVVKSAWAMKPDRMVVSTCTLDHKRALPAYQKIGFVPVSFREETMQQWLGNMNVHD